MVKLVIEIVFLHVDSSNDVRFPFAPVKKLDYMLLIIDYEEVLRAFQVRFEQDYTRVRTLVYGLDLQLFGVQLVIQTNLYDLRSGALQSDGIEVGPVL